MKRRATVCQAAFGQDRPVSSLQELVALRRLVLRGAAAVVLTGVVIAVAQRSRRLAVALLASAAVVAGAVRRPRVVPETVDWLGRKARTARRPHAIEAAVTVNASAEEVYRFWRAFENHARVLTIVGASQPDGDGRRYRHALPSPAGQVGWTVEIVEEVPNERIEWRSVAGAPPVPYRAALHLRPDAKEGGTQLRLRMELEPRTGVLGRVLLAGLDELSDRVVQTDLRRFKQLIEAGEIATTEGQPAGAGRSAAHSRHDNSTVSPPRGSSTG